MEICSTKQYDRFKTTANRNVDSKHVEKLMESFKGNPNVLSTCPVIVNNDMYIIDGQHRIAAAKELKYPIFYIKVSSANKSDSILKEIHDRNVGMKKWGIHDYVEFHASQENPEYCFINKIIRDYPVRMTSLLCICKCQGNHAKRYTALKKGTLKILNKDSIIEFFHCFFSHFNDIPNSIPYDKKDALLRGNYLAIFYEMYINPELDKFFRMSIDIFFSKFPSYWVRLGTPGDRDQAYEYIKNICRATKDRI